MKIVVPVSRSDSGRINKWVDCVKKFGGMETHSIHFIPTNSVASIAYEAAGKLGEVCKDVRVTPLDMDSDLGWPMAPNWQWFKTAQIMEPLATPWFWMELDCLPARSGWATELGSEYTSGGTPFRGCIVKTPWKDGNGNEIPSPDGPDDKMMCGCGIYPSYLHERLAKIGQTGIMLDFAKGAASADNPWDLHLRSVMRALGMGHTELIGDYWNTCNYRVEDGSLICDAKETDGNGNKTKVHRSGVINPSAVVIHGCKDESLYNLIMGGLDTRILAPLKPEPAAQPSPHIPQLTEDPRIAAMERQLAEMRSMLSDALKAKETPKEEPLLNRLMADEMSEEDPSEVIVKCIRNSKTKLRLAQVAGLTNISAEIIRELANSPDAEFEIGKGGLAWLSLKAPKKKFKFNKTT